MQLYKAEDYTPILSAMRTELHDNLAGFSPCPLRTTGLRTTRLEARSVLFTLILAIAALLQVFALC